MDLLVLQSQRWLNAVYGGRTGYARIAEDGATGWETMYGLTRALQLELGITATSDTFGPTTMSRLTSAYGTIGAGFTANKNVVTIIQCALWCKGYPGGAILAFGETDPSKNIGAFTTEVGAAVAAIRADMGISASPTVPPKIFKSLLNMDAYVTVTGGTDRFRQIQRYLNGRHWNRADFGIIPCDGIYSRDVQQGVMYALQYGLGMADGVANGNFGPGTQSGIRNQANLAIGSSDDDRGFVTLFQALLCFNGFDTEVSGTYTTSTVATAKAFQGFADLPTHGSADFTTWASLLVSTGDPDRPVIACDTSTPVSDAQATLLRSNGYAIVGRYLNGSAKGIQATELDRLFTAGLSVFPIYQEWNNLDELRDYGPDTFGYRQGRAAALRARQLGFASGTTIYFPIDADATADEIEALVIPYFQGVNRGIALSSSVPYTVGCYGPRNVGIQVAAKGLAATSFVAGLSTGWSANLGFPLPKNWAYDQIQETTVGSGSSAIAIDRDASSSRAKPATRATVLPTPVLLNNFDRTLYWPFADYCYQAEIYREEHDTTLDNADLTQILLNTLQRTPENGVPREWDGKFQLYTPFIDNSDIGRARAAFESTLPDHRTTPMLGEDPDELADRRAAFTTMLDSTSYDIAHFAASTRGYLQWGTYGGSPDSQVGDLGAWALDLVQAWGAYELARQRGETQDAGSWLKARIGGTSAAADSSGFGYSDLIADIDAYLAAMNILDNQGYTRTDPDATLATTMREIWAAASQDPLYRQRTFTAVRFNANQETARSAVRHLFRAGWDQFWLKAPVNQTLHGLRRPGDPATKGPTIPAATLAAELDQVAGAFTDVLFAGL